MTSNYQYRKSPITRAFLSLNLAERTGLEPATLCVTGRYSNQLNYRSKLQPIKRLLRQKNWRPQGDSNPRTHRERVMS